MVEKDKIKNDLSLFSQKFKDDEACLRFLNKQKWGSGFVCPHCGNVNFCKGKKKHTRRCTRCKKEISPTAHTVFHRCRIPLKKAFEIVYLSCKYPDISSYDISDILEIRRMTCYHFQKRVKECKQGDKDFALLKKIQQSVVI